MPLCRTQGTSGFTLVEMLLTIALLSILAVAAYVAWPGSTLPLSGTANTLAANLRYTQSLSMTSGQRYRLVKISASTYQIQNSSGSAITLPSGNSTATLGSNITFSALSNLPDNLIVFDGRGTPYTDTAGTELAATAVFTLTAGGQSTTVSVTPGTGRVTVP